MAIACAAACALASPPTIGPCACDGCCTRAPTKYSHALIAFPQSARTDETTFARFTDPSFDSSDPAVWVWWPVPKNSSHGEKFPLVPYLHGILGGDIGLAGYSPLFGQMASWGFVIAGTFACNTGCHDGANSSRWTECGGLLPLAPLGMGWSSYYAEAFKIIAWARNMSSGGSAEPVFQLIDHNAGYAVVGHSMGGQGAAVAATNGCPQLWDIKGVALHHPANCEIPAGNIGVNVTIPIAGFTSSGDPSSPETLALISAFDQRADSPRLAALYRNVDGWSHLEPILWPPIENPLLATYTAAWLKVILTGDRSYFYDLVFGSGVNDLCQSENMTACFTRPPL